MKTARRILALVLVMVIALTAIPLTASAGIADTAKSITSGQTVSATIKDFDHSLDYKIVVSKAGELKLSVNAYMQTMHVMVYDSNGNIVEPDDYSSTSGSCSYYNNFDYLNVRWNNVVEQSDFKVVYPVKKGTYYIRYEWDWNIYADNQGNGKIKFAATYPSTVGKAAKITYLSATLSKGSKLQMGTVLSPANGATVTWKSNNPKIASVTSNGLITAKSKGSTYICATCGSSRMWFLIKVK